MEAVKRLEINDLREDHNAVQDTAELDGVFDRHFYWMSLFLPTFEGLEHLIFTFHDETDEFGQLPPMDETFEEMLDLITEGWIAPGQN
jgi:hypothetical protein